MRFRPWNDAHVPRKILAMRFQALGDMIITLPYLQSLKRQFPGIKIHFFTREEISGVPEATELFDRVIRLRGGRRVRLQVMFALLKLPFLFSQGYDAVLDLQNNKVSRLVRKLLQVNAWSEFDKYASLPAGERVRLALDALAPWKSGLDTSFRLNIDVEGLLCANNWKMDHELVVLNPAGNFPSRNWALENYVQFARAWMERIHPKTQFVLLLLPSNKDKADFIASRLGGNCIDLTGLANQAEAFAVISKCRFVLSEDSGLMHMAWTQGIPTLALFSSSRKDWSQPLGRRSLCLDSSDMECGPCMSEICKYNDNRCLSRYTPDVVIRHAMALIQPEKR